LNVRLRLAGILGAQFQFGDPVPELGEDVPDRSIYNQLLAIA